MKPQFILLFLVAVLFTSCIVQSPKYSTFNQVLNLKLGMTKTEVETELGVKPYDLKSINDSGITYIYIYRVVDRKTASVYTKPTNGKDVLGKYSQLSVTFNYSNKLTHIKSCQECPDTLEKTKVVNFEKLILFVTVTLPVILIYLGLN